MPGLSISKQKQLTQQKFSQLKTKFLTSSQQKTVHLIELNKYWELNSDDYGVTFYDRVNNQMHVAVHYFAKHNKNKELLDTIAHEFAHVYLNFTSPEHEENKEHKKWTKHFYDYLNSLKK